jgi:hypothetical protein
MPCINKGICKTLKVNESYVSDLIDVSSYSNIGICIKIKKGNKCSLQIEHFINCDINLMEPDLIDSYNIQSDSGSFYSLPTKTPLIRIKVINSTNNAISFRLSCIIN